MLGRSSPFWLVSVLVGLLTFGLIPSKRSQLPTRLVRHTRRSQPPATDLTGSLFGRHSGIAVRQICPRHTSASRSCHERVFVSGHLGKSWSDASPGHFEAEQVVADLAFLDPQRWWFVTNNCGPFQSYVYGTADNGAAWWRHLMGGAECHGGTISTDFVDQTHGWYVYIEPAGPFATIRRTSDGGRTWSREQDLPTLGDVSFIDRRLGYLAETWYAGGRLYRSRSAGRRWARFRVPRPSRYRHATLAYDTPTFQGHRGTLPVSLVKKHREDEAFYISRDGGRTWKLGCVVRPHVHVHKGTTGRAAPLSTDIVNRRVWWLVAKGAPYIYKTRDGGNTWSRFRSKLHGIESISAIGRRRAWASAIGPGGHRERLYRTLDGGRSWHRLHVRS
ncbi:MAG: hypothetical protein QOC87_1726 [Actinomycetota bacterium]|jgi:photosystem II stability/assembly factor-like uncharacterized protein|nr:hypothetical protein [Actinomycetota bacterium]